MKYIVHATIIFPDLTTAAELAKAVKQWFDKALNVQFMGTTVIEVEECHHDETPPKPCVILQRIEKP